MMKQATLVNLKKEAIMLTVDMITVASNFIIEVVVDSITIITTVITYFAIVTVVTVIIEVIIIIKIGYYYKGLVQLVSSL